MRNLALRIINWNVRWQHPKRSLNGEIISKEISDRKPEVVCITEGHQDFFDDGYTICSDPDYGYRQIKGRRKVLLWSKNPWEEINIIGHEALPTGRFVSGTTKTSMGNIKFIGLCIPWQAAHVSSGRKDRKLWQDHKTYLTGLNQFLHEVYGTHTIILGDFNQKVPRPKAGHKQPAEVYEMLINTFPKAFNIATEGILDDIQDQAIDHVVYTDDLVLKGLKGIKKDHPDLGPGKELSDHYAVVVDLAKSKE